MVSGSPTTDFLGLPRHFLSPKSRLFGTESEFFNSRSVVGVEKVPQQAVFHLRACRRRFSCLVRLGGGRQNRCGRLTEEANQSLDVLSYRSQKELLAHKLQSSQTQATQSDLILQLREQGFHLLSLSLCLRELRRLRQLPCALSYGLMDVNGEILVSSSRALGFLQASPAAFRATGQSCRKWVKWSIRECLWAGHQQVMTA
jgi:hypothetical protein